jgi:hypothetical protein
VRSLYIKIFSASFWITFLSPRTATSINIHVTFSLSRITMSGLLLLLLLLLLLWGVLAIFFFRWAGGWPAASTHNLEDLWAEWIRGLMGEKGLVEKDWNDRHNRSKKII